MSDARNDPARHVDLVEIHLGSGGTARVKPEDAFTHERFLSTLRERFGEHARNWAFACPNCGDVATGLDFRAALADHPRTRRDGEPVIASDIMGQQCIGRTLGALTKGEYTGRGCDWAAGGLFSGPIYVELPPTGEESEPRWVPSFRIAPANAVSDRDTLEGAG